ncbi:ScyD/ScyE family protein [Cesiribacter sp. SM1]|uniref:ScyD/ScyE family protein n=1 Tax=Cesiribacter sp. SM1 TaxID=2861196 RepID=UPI001CD2A76D|nr:ScyD/ScyE family protein [Cesiribacter sp. SM1]
MKNFSLLLLMALVMTITSCHYLDDIFDEVEPTKPLVQTYATGLSAPIGLVMGDQNRLWVSENGPGAFDGQVSMIMPGGMVYPAIVGFPTYINPEGLPGGVNHLAYKNGMLYILSEVDGRLYMADVSKFRPGSTPVQASELAYHEIRSFILDYDFGPLDTNESNLYNLTFGPGGDLFIVDAAANAIIRRDAGDASLSVFAFIPDIPNPTPVGPPTIDVVPNGIVWDGERFLISTLIGFPFPAGESRIYELDHDGNISVYQEGFTSLVDIALGHDQLPMVLQFSEFSLANGGFQPMQGKVIIANGTTQTILKDKLNMPTSLELDGRKAYVTSLADGTVTRIIW